MCHPNTNINSQTAYARKIQFPCPRCKFPLEKLNLDDLAKLSSAVFARISEEKAEQADTGPKWNFEESSIFRPRAIKDKEA